MISWEHLGEEDRMALVVIVGAGMVGLSTAMVWPGAATT